MSRQAERERAAAILGSLGGGTPVFPTIFEGAVRSLAGSALPAISLISAGTEVLPGTRGGVAGLAYRYAASIYVSCEIGTEAAAEDLIDSLSGVAAAALAGTAGFTDINSDAGAQGAPLRAIDGVVYRVERITFTREDYDL
jgi:hypothetical protein